MLVARIRTIAITRRSPVKRLIYRAGSLRVEKDEDRRPTGSNKDRVDPHLVRKLRAPVIYRGFFPGPPPANKSLRGIRRGEDGKEAINVLGNEKALFNSFKLSPGEKVCKKRVKQKSKRRPF
ncbi:Hypothetical protein NTJ_07934 [Nesidiocoris tenuis]|uniref:Uncharacterized protein n=1 Tax=Nesidiocoris tenuis TaxID=355587 RepID=A0ABN7ASD7_9HEMI|nr:Hypothetical protein NTJ_07934 [Nesidiocoris tenuis]